MLILALGDLYIPDRTIAVPPKFRKLISPFPEGYPSNYKISEVLCLGNLTNSFETLKGLYLISPTFHLVRGEYDNDEIILQQLSGLQKKEIKSIPVYKIVNVHNIRIGFTNGHQVVPRNDPLSLLALTREWDVDILVWGGTHKAEAFEMEGKLFVNPGSLTGAPSYDWPDLEPEEDDLKTNQNSLSKEPNNIGIREVNTKEDLTKEGEGNITSYSEGVASDEQKEEALNAGDKEEGKSAEYSIPLDEKATTQNDKNEEKANEDIGNEKNETTDIRAAHLEEKTKTKAIFDKVKELTSYIPSFCLLDIHDFTCTLYIYTYLNDEVKVDKVRYKKK